MLKKLKAAHIGLSLTLNFNMNFFFFFSDARIPTEKSTSEIDADLAQSEM